MHILYIVHQFYPEFYSGTEKFLLNLSSTLQKDGHFVRLVTYSFNQDGRTPDQNRKLSVRKYFYNNIPVVSLKHKIIPPDINISCDDQEIYAFAMKFLQQEKRCDMLHIAHPMRLSSFARAATSLGIPYMLTLTDFWLICPKVTLQTSSGSLCTGPEGGTVCRQWCPELHSEFVRTRLRMAEKVLRGATAIVSPSRFLASIFRKEIPDLNIQIIPHGMNLQFLDASPKKYKKGDRIVFGFCGGLAPHKGVHLLLKAFRNLHSTNAELKVYGSCGQETDYLQLLQEIAGRDDRITFCGPYGETEVGKILRGIDVIAVPSIWYENYPLVLHEALACNVPVIASNIGGMAEKIKDSINGFTFRAGDKDDLESKLRDIVGNPEILNEIKQKLNECNLPMVEEEAYMYQRLYRLALPVSQELAALKRAGGMDQKGM